MTAGSIGGTSRPEFDALKADHELVVRAVSNLAVYNDEFQAEVTTMKLFQAENVKLQGTVDSLTTVTEPTTKRHTSEL